MAGLGYAGPSSRIASMAEFNFLQLRTAVTVATLPTPPAGSAPAGGGSAKALVWFNGTAWRVIGI